MKKQLPIHTQLLLMANIIGLGFHPDTNMEDYINQDGKPSFSPDMAKDLNEKLDQCHEALGDDIYNMDWDFKAHKWYFSN